MLRLMGALFTLVFLLASQAHAVPVSSYTMNNGYGQAQGGTYNYWDKEYGVGGHVTAGELLSGSTGNLTDGVIAGGNWFNVENAAGTGPYVGWRDVNPTITFYFPSVYNLTGVRIHFDDAKYGGVSAPSKVIINGVEYIVVDPSGTDPFWAAFDINVTSDQLAIQLVRNDDTVFASEFQFDGTLYVAPEAPEEHHAVPEPTAAMMLLSGLGMVVMRRWQKRGAAIA